MNILALPALWYLRTFPGKVDESYGLIEKLNLESDLSQSNWQSLEDKMSQLSPDEFSRVISELCNGKQYNDEMEKFLQTPETEFQNVIAGAYFTRVAYLKRSGAWATELSEDQVNGMFEYLEKAEERFGKEFKTELYQMEAAAQMIGVKMNTGSKADCTFYFEKCRSINPKHFMAHNRYFRTSTPRWGGSNEAMLSLIVSTKDKPLRDLMRLMALNEMFNDLHNEDEDTAVGIFKEQRRTLITEALQNTPIPNNDSIVSIFSKNYLGMLYNILGMNSDRDRIIGELSNRVTQYPWAYYGMHCEKDIKMFRRVGMLEV